VYQTIPAPQINITILKGQVTAETSMGAFLPGLSWWSCQGGAGWEQTGSLRTRAEAGCHLGERRKF
jgi:hypothetical protein